MRTETLLRRKLKTFYPHLPPHVMTELDEVIERHIEKVKQFNKKSK